MAVQIASLMKGIETDPWRAEKGFSPDIRATLELTLKATSDSEVVSALNDWIARYQPCFFGRIAAKQSAITYCLIREEMLGADDRVLSKHIQDARTRWTAAGFAGNTSNFIIAVLSEHLANALPNDAVKQVALRLCSLYLQEEVSVDRVYLDHLYLEMPGRSNAAWEWVVGVNYFSAQGDGRWWQDHRFPAGMAFSMNSVGHLVKSGKLMRALNDLEAAMGTALSDMKSPKIETLEKALELAMRTIHFAKPAVSGKATFLVPRCDSDTVALKCPVELPPDLADMDYRQYRGYYHTDFTLPSEYFKPDVIRPSGIQPYVLDFTYLFDKDLDNPDHDRMGEGRRIRTATISNEVSDDAQLYPIEKRLRGIETEVRVTDVRRLPEALGLSD